MGRKGVCRHTPGHLYLFGRFQIINSVSFSMRGESRVQVNVSIRYLSFARKSFFIGLLLLNIMTRVSVGKSKKRVCLYFSLLCVLSVPGLWHRAPLFGENGFPMGPRGILWNSKEINGYLTRLIGKKRCVLNLQNSY